MQQKGTELIPVPEAAVGRLAKGLDVEISARKHPIPALVDDAERHQPRWVVQLGIAYDAYLARGEVGIDLVPA